MLGVDIHSHLIPGVDDGSRGPVETIAMARGLADLGVERVYLTPHQYKLGNRFEVMEVKRHADEVWRILARAEVKIEVRPGAEYYYGEELLDAIAGREELITFEWEDEQHILIELPMHQPAFGVEKVGDALLRRQIRPVLAHPERAACIANDYPRVYGWRDAGWRMQLNLLSLVECYGRRAAALAHRMLEDRLYDFTGSDLHRPAELPWLGQAHRLYRSIAERGVHA